MNFIVVVGKRNAGSFVVTATLDRWIRILIGCLLAFALANVIVMTWRFGLVGFLAGLERAMTPVSFSFAIAIGATVAASFVFTRNAPLATDREKRDAAVAGRDALRFRVTVAQICGLAPIAGYPELTQHIAETMGLRPKVARLEKRITELQGFADAEAAIRQLRQEAAQHERDLAAARHEADSNAGRAATLQQQNLELGVKLERQGRVHDHLVADLRRQIAALQGSSRAPTAS